MLKYYLSFAKRTSMFLPSCFHQLPEAAEAAEAAEAVEAEEAEAEPEAQ